MPRVEAIDHLVLTVADMDRSIAFYRDVLGMIAQTFTAADGSTRQALSLGPQKINLHVANAPFEPHADRPVSGSADLCFLSATPLSDWQAHMEVRGTKIIIGPVARSGAKGPIRSIYIRDPDGNLIEIANPA